MPAKKIIIMGSGFGGLCSAVLLAKQGYDVTVLEKNARLGGRAMTFDQKGYHFDMGPSWYLMPEVFEDYFKLFGKDITQYIKLHPLDPMYRMFFSPTDHVDIVRSLDKNLKLFESFEKGAGASIKAYLDESKVQYDIAMKYFLYTEFRTIFDFLKPQLFTVGKKVPVLKNLQDHIASYTRDPRLQKILGYTMVFLGGAPSNTPALYSLMSHVDYNLGVFYPMGGFGALVDAFVKLGKEYGVRYITSHPVIKIETERGKATTVKTTKKNFSADIVLANADYQHVESKLLNENDRSYSSSYWESKTLAPSAFIIHLGMKGRVPNLQHHNLILTQDWQKHFDAIFDKPKWPQKPSYYVCCPTKTDTTIAPKNCDELFILVPVAAGLKDTPQKRKKYYEKIMDDLELHINYPIRKNITYKRMYAHNDFATDYNAYKGTALGLAHTLSQTAILRPAMKSKKVSNLYFVGQYTQPGIGVPIAVISAQLAAKRICEEN